MSKRILYVVNELPFPPRNGVTIPAYHYLKELSANGYQIDLLYLPRNSNWNDPVLLERNKVLVNNLWTITLRKQSNWKVLIHQLLLISPSFYGYDFDETQLTALLKGKKYDSIIYTPISATIVLDALKKCDASSSAAQIGILNDCYSYAVKIKSKVNTQIFSFSWKEKVKMKIEYLNSYFIRYFERKIVKQLDVLVCQTEIDANAFRDLSYQNKLLILSNGVPDSLYQKKLSSNSIHKILFLGSLNGKYAHVAEWLILTAWPFILSRHPHLRLKLVGKGLSSNLIRHVQSEASIEYVPFVESIEEVYDDAQILLAPIFMHCGLINKVIESMAAGTVVIGDVTSFNGIPEFADGKHGLVFDDLEGMLQKLDQLVENDELYRDIRTHAKEINLKHFNWTEKVKVLISHI